MNNTGELCATWPVSLAFAGPAKVFSWFLTPTEGALTDKIGAVVHKGRFHKQTEKEIEAA